MNFIVENSEHGAQFAVEFYGSDEDEKEFFSHLYKGAKEEKIDICEPLSKDEVGRRLTKKANTARDKGQPQEYLRYRKEAADDTGDAKAQRDYADALLEHFSGKEIPDNEQEEILDYWRRSAEQGDMHLCPLC